MKVSGGMMALLVICLAGAGATGYWVGAKRAESQTYAAAPAAVERSVLYYRNPMGLPDTSPVPKKDSMGMDYLPVYADDKAMPGIVRIDLDKLQKLGVRTEPVVSRQLARTVHAVGRFLPDERRIVTVTTKFEGYIERLLVNATGQAVARGQALMEVYSPELVSAQEEYLVARTGQSALEDGTEESVAGVEQLAESALRRLRNWDISDAQLQRLQRDGKATRTLTLHAAEGGVVLEKAALQGMRFMPGDPLLQIADLRTVWLIVDVFEQDLDQVQIGQPASIRVDAYPEREFGGEVAYIYPTLSPETRAVQVRIEMDNSEGLFKPDLFASVELSAGDAQVAAQGTVLAVPESAVIDSGRRQVVLVKRAEGLFEPREVRLGLRANGYVEVLDGVSEGDEVVVRGNFLIDAESNLQSALDSFGGHGAHGEAAPDEKEPEPSDDHSKH